MGPPADRRGSTGLRAQWVETWRERVEEDRSDEKKAVDLFTTHSLFVTGTH